MRPYAGSHPRRSYLQPTRCVFRRRAGAMHKLKTSSLKVGNYLTAWRAFGSLKYRHHFGLDCFSIAGEHWTLQASLAHSIKDDVFVLSCACGLDASALAGSSLDGFVGGKICSVGGRMCPVATTFTGFSSKVPLSAHPARARARDAANSHFIFAPMMQGQTPHHGSLEALKG